MKPIETRYAGCHFRSRLEARWAVFFDTLDIQWQYEPQGFELPSGRRYLPDFWLPEQRDWLEVKGATPSRTEQVAAIEFAAGFDFRDQRVKLLVGDVPDPRLDLPGVAEHYIWNGDPDRPQPKVSGWDGWVWWPSPVRGGFWRRELWQQCRKGHVTTRFPRSCAIRGCDEPASVTPAIRYALEAARSARFEHGQGGRT